MATISSRSNKILRFIAQWQLQAVSDREVERAVRKIEDSNDDSDANAVLVKVFRLGYRTAVHNDYVGTDAAGAALDFQPSDPVSVSYNEFFGLLRVSLDVARFITEAGQKSHHHPVAIVTDSADGKVYARFVVALAWQRLSKAGFKRPAKTISIANAALADAAKKLEKASSKEEREAIYYTLP